MRTSGCGGVWKRRARFTLFNGRERSLQRLSAAFRRVDILELLASSGRA